MQNRLSKIALISAALVLIVVSTSLIGAHAIHDNPTGWIVEQLSSIPNNAERQAAAPNQNQSQTAVVSQTDSETHFQPGSRVFIRIFKAERALELWLQAKSADSKTPYQLYKTYPICSFSGDPGPKLKEGDHQAPEGFYRVKASSLNPNSRYHLSFNLGFPNQYDRAHGRTGSFLMVHGGCVSVGCYAMTDQGIDEIYHWVAEALAQEQSAVAVHAFPFRMTTENLAEQQASPWHDFWLNLQEGYDAFNANHLPPQITVKSRRYIVQD